MPKFYAVRRGRKRGVYTSWPETQEQVALFPSADFKSFPTRTQAEAYVGLHADDVVDAIPYVEIHCGGRTTFAALTNEVREALTSAGVEIA